MCCDGEERLLEQESQTLKNKKNDQKGFEHMKDYWTLVEPNVTVSSPLST